MVVAICRLRIGLDRAPEELNRFPKSSLLQADQPETIKCIELTIVSTENDLVAALRLPEMADLVKGSCFLQRSANVDDPPVGKLRSVSNYGSPIG